ncbi:MAG: carnitine-CoA ligase [Solirubrobacteraceae bacterium]
MQDLIGNRTLPTLLAERVERHADESWLVFEDAEGGVEEHTYAGFQELVQRAAGGLAALGVEEGDRVGLHLANCPEFLVALFALAQLGAIAVPSNVANQAPEMTHVLGFSEAKLLVTAPAYLELFEQVLPGTPSVQHTIVARGAAPEGTTSFAELLQAPLRREVATLEPETPVQMIFTSGTTAQPKGVVLTHGNCVWSSERESRSLGLDAGERVLTALPLFHVNAQSLSMLSALAVGGTLILLECFRATKFMDQVRRHRATQTSIVAMLARTLLAQPAREDDADHALRRVFYAINVTDEEKDRFERRFGVELINGYGLSEAMTLVSVAPVHGPKRWPSVGMPALDRVVRIVDEAGEEVEPGVVGEITVKGVPGRTLMKEYWRDPDATARTLVDGWLHTGDNGYVDELGYLYFYDRAKDVIKRAGENISATEVESVLAQHPAIAQAAVIAVPDPIRDEAVKAFVVVADGHELTEEEVVAHCAAHLARFKVPTIVELRDSLPMTSIGKIEKKVLRQEARTAQAVTAR